MTTPTTEGYDDEFSYAAGKLDFVWDGEYVRLYEIRENGWRGNLLAEIDFLNWSRAHKFLSCAHQITESDTLSLD